MEQARTPAQEWLAEVRGGGDPGAAKTAVRKAPTVAELCVKFMEDQSQQCNKPGTQAGYAKCIKRNIVPMLGRMKMQDETRPDIAGATKEMAHKPADANRTLSAMRKIFNLAEVWGYRPDSKTGGMSKPLSEEAYRRLDPHPQAYRCELRGHV